MSRTLVISEPGCTAEGDHGTYIRLIETAASCGADVFKPQWVSDPVRMCERRHIGLDHPKRSYYERAYRWLSFPLEWHAEFSARAKALGMQYACTSFLPEDVAKVDTFVDIHKIASFESEDEAMWPAVYATAKAIIASAGMQTHGVKHWGCRWLHCVSSYPAPLDAMNLAALLYDEEGGHSDYVGLSDHSRNLLTGAVAVGAGAQIIETHFRLDDCHPMNPDYAVSFRPVEFKTYIDFIRQAETMMGSGEKRVQDCEREMLSYRVTG